MSTLHPPKTSSESGRPSIAQVVDKLEMELPPLESKQPFTHTSRYGATKQAFEVPEGSMCYDNETLEHYGDALVNWTASKLIKSLYPRLVPGSSTLLRTTLICNDTLALLSDHFGLPSRLRAALGQMEDLKKNPKVKANLFEAYVCGVWDEYGEKEAVGWLEGVFEPIARNEYGRMKGAQGALLEWTQKDLANRVFQEIPTPPRQGAQFYRLKYGHKDRLKEVEAYETNKKVAKQAAAYQACVDLNIVPR
ncbi:hypothetical protein MNV49_007472 [Pseudohyphozyma bogoriensis]|nr:hypothetical protein MNV49_007472 [Pseudohyphozyma bogoriensis]